MNNIVSVVIPAYNVEDYIDNMLASVISQSYSDLEIIVVDDGSTDITPEILKKYAQKDDRIILFQKDNEGQSSARNYGLTHVHGRFFMFVDSDDVLDRDYIKYLVEAIDEYEADVAVCGLTMRNGKTERKLYAVPDRLLDDRSAIVKEYLLGKYGFGPCCKLMRTDKYKDEFFIEGRIFEDVEYLSRIFLKTDRLVHINKCGYFYNVREGSTTHSDFTIKKTDMLYTTRVIAERIRSSDVECSHELLSFETYSYVSFLMLCAEASKMDEYSRNIKPLLKWLRTKRGKIIKSKSIKLNQKVYAFVFATENKLLIKLLLMLKRIV